MATENEVDTEDLRSVIEAAIEENEEETESSASAPEEEEIKEESEEESEEPKETEEIEEEGKVPEAKFLPPEGEEGEGEEEEKAPLESGPPAPVSWRGAAKAEWSKVPNEARQEIIRREREVDKVLRDTVEARRFQQSFNQVVAPFQNFIAAGGGDALVSTRNLMQTAAVLQAGSPAQKAQIAAKIVQDFGVDIEMLDSALVGQPMQANGSSSPNIEHLIDQRMAPVTKFVQQWEQRARAEEQALEQSVEEELDAFEADPKNIFFRDVQDDIMVMMSIAAERGEELSLADAYDRAVRMRPEFLEVVERQSRGKKVSQNRKTLEQKKRAASSVQARTPQAAGGPEGPDPNDLRAVIMAAMGQYESD